MGIKMVGNGVVPFPCGSGRGKTFSQTRNIVPFGSERGKTSFQTREADEKKEKEEKKEATRVWKRKNVLPDPRRAKLKEMTVEERSTDSDRGIQKIVGNQMLNHAGV